MVKDNTLFDLSGLLDHKDDPVAIKRTLCGINNENLDFLEKEFEVKIQNDTLGFNLIGETGKLYHLRGILESLIPVARKGDISVDDVKTELEHIDMKKAATIKTQKSAVTARTFMQSAFIESMSKNDLIFGVGPAGTGKTFLAVAYAAMLLEKGDVKRIVLSRPAVEAGENLGFLPGDMKEKVDPYLRPLYDALYEMLPAEKVDKFIETNVIEIAPLAFLRGRTLKDAAIILDEAQNTTAAQMKMILTRIGENSKMIVTGDPTQIDLPSRVKSGLKDALDTLRRVENMAVIKFGNRDVIRHKLVSQIVQAYDMAQALKKYD
jgi:phosphate starvation-inducible PhoH-like protein